MFFIYRAINLLTAAAEASIQNQPFAGRMLFRSFTVLGSFSDSNPISHPHHPSEHVALSATLYHCVCNPNDNSCIQLVASLWVEIRSYLSKKSDNDNGELFTS